ncbi:MAG: alpha-L-rhamnosidase [Anaerolineae bacterium]|nr:alpha-L-rhamnosidase [Anaerolineae bacterium]
MTDNPFLNRQLPNRGTSKNWHTGRWPARWITYPGATGLPLVMAFRCEFTLKTTQLLLPYISADERYVLYCDGVQIGRGPERGDPRHWFFTNYALDLPAGKHMLAALVWALGEQAPLAQFSVMPGLIVASPIPEQNALFGTGVASWEAKLLSGVTFSKNKLGFGVGANVEIDANTFDLDFMTGGGEGWIAPQVGPAGYSAGSFNQHGEHDTEHWLIAAMLPGMRDTPWRQETVRYVTSGGEGYLKPTAKTDLAGEHAAWEALLLEEKPLTLLPHTGRRVLVDLNDYVCGYTHVSTTGGKGATIRASWAESLYESEITEWHHAFHGRKGCRDEVLNKTFCGEGDGFRPDGGTWRTFEPLWWKAGRYVLIEVHTANTPLTIERLEFRESRYPLDPEGKFESDLPQLARVWPLMTRVLQMCSHETYMDCPYYEQLMYVGDTRLEALATYCLTHDDRLPRKALLMFDASRFPNGLTQSRYPSRSTQVIPPFSLWWCGMVYDYALWRDDEAFVRALMPGVRGVMDAFLAYRNEAGLVEGPPGWNYVDWTTDPDWHRGVPPDGEGGVSGAINWQFVYTLNLIAQLEMWLGEAEAAARAQRYAAELAGAIETTLWDEKRGMFADTLDHRHFSEHTQCLALLSGMPDLPTAARVGEGLLKATDLTRTTIYFSHYLLETCRLLGRDDKLFARLEEWFELPDMGFKTVREQPEPSRSDCHAWGAHPIYHAYASILGIRPVSMGFRQIVIRPLLGPLTKVNAILPHPQGEIAVQLEKTASGGLSGVVTLPGSVSGDFFWNGQVCELIPGTQTIFMNSRK